MTAAIWPECRGCHRQHELGEALPRTDRSFAEILQEVRVAQTAMQLLVAFLLTAPFAPQFALSTAGERAVYVTSLISGTFANALLIAPVPFHRFVWGRRMKRELVRAADRFAKYGLALMLISVVSALLMTLDAVVGFHPALILTGGALTLFVGTWYVAPLTSLLICHRRDDARVHGDEPHGDPARS
jgi:hypothetical protein